MEIKFRWSEEISVGDELLDSQHRQLLLQVNKLLEAMLEGDVEVINNVIDFLDTYISQHLTHEELYMTEHKYPQVEEHKQLHKNFIDSYESFKKRLQQQGPNESLVMDVENYIGNWWMNHIGVEDKKYANYIINQNSDKS